MQPCDKNLIYLDKEEQDSFGQSWQSFIAFALQELYEKLILKKQDTWSAVREHLLQLNEFGQVGIKCKSVILCSPWMLLEHPINVFIELVELSLWVSYC